MGAILSTVAAGDMVTILEGEGPATVLPGCGGSMRGHWFCVTHRQHLPNEFDKSAHIERGEHVMGWWCHVHGLEQP